MSKTHARKITPADQKAAQRLKTIWLTHDDRPTQQALADAWDGDGELLVRASFSQSPQEMAMAMIEEFE